MSDRPIHLPPSTVPHQEACIHADVWITQSALDGICQLLTFCEGLERAGKGTIPGAFDLVMHYRQLREAVDKAVKAVRTAADEFVEVSEA